MNARDEGGAANLPTLQNYGSSAARFFAVLLQRPQNSLLGRIQNERNERTTFGANFQELRKVLKIVAALIFVEALLFECFRPCQYRRQLFRRDFGQAHG